LQISLPLFKRRLGVEVQYVVNDAGLPVAARTVDPVDVLREAL
jgi:hypothetical protein